jgi:hypothetical protein
MNVKQLIEGLAKFPLDKEVWFQSRDGLMGDIDTIEMEPHFLERHADEEIVVLR